MCPDDLPDVTQLGPVVEITIAEIARAHPEIISDLGPLSPVHTAVAFASLLKMPQFQANYARIEALVHLAIGYCDGDAPPTTENIRKQFNRAGEGYCGKMEDPVEDVFLSLVNSQAGNFRVFEGLLEGSGFHLQRILNIVEGMPNRPPFDRIRRAVASIMRLSDAVAARACLKENTLGIEIPHRTLPVQAAEQALTTSQVVQFDERDLAELQIPKECLSDFVFDLSQRTIVRNQIAGNTDLERRPIVVDGGNYYLLLPTSVATAIIRMVIDSVSSIGSAKVFELALCNEYARLFYEESILGKRLPEQLKFDKISSGYVSAAMTEVDSGRFLHLVFFVDTIDNFSDGTMRGSNGRPDVLSAVLSSHIKHAASEAKTRDGFRDGISILVACGFGRAIGIEDLPPLPEAWRFEGISAYDLATLNWVDEFEALSLWRLLDARESVEKLGVILFNVNGLLNLVAWCRQLGGHLVPHGELPEGFVAPDSENLLLVRQNAIRDLRHKVQAEWNPRRVPDMDGRWVKARKLDKGEFDEDNLAPFYGSEDDIHEGRLRGVYLAARRAWWISINPPEDSSRQGVYQRWLTLCAWVKRAAPILDEAYSMLNSPAIEYEATFDEIVGTTRGPVHPKSATELKALIQFSGKAGSPQMPIRICSGFDDGLAQPENVAERMLVGALVEAAAISAGEQANLEKQARLVQEICPDPAARHSHRLEARSFRDSVRSEIQPKLLLIDPLDDGAVRIGLGWRDRSKESTSKISGIAECTSYLNHVVRTVLDDLCSSLRTMDRRLFIKAVLENHEATASDRDVWKQTARAILAMHQNKPAAKATILRHHARLNASFLSTRILMEAAICECPLEGGSIPGRLDVSRAMARAVFSHHIGGWSDAIHWGAMEPQIRVTPLGDIYVDQSFLHNVYEPFGRESAEADVTRAAESYEKLFEPPETIVTTASVFEIDFLEAWQKEFGVTLDGLRSFVEELEDMGREVHAPILDIPRSHLVSTLASCAKLSLAEASSAVSLLTLKSRPSWRIVPAQYAKKDWFPWRFRRRLSVFRRPLLQVDDEADPKIILAPGLLRDALFLNVSWLHSGEVPSAQARSVEMCKWIGRTNNIQRTQFNSTVALKMRELGWEATPEVKLTKILGRSLYRDYGDIDVLAWKQGLGRVLAIECKDLQRNMTIGQVAEQLSDFRGELTMNGKPDHLRKHLDRMEVLNTHRSEVAKFLKLETSFQIEGHLVFRNLVPMRFAWEKMASRIRLSLFSELDRL
jgi:hypothetical protein